MTGPAHAASSLLDAQRRSLAEAITDRQYELHPELAQRYGPAGRAHCLRDAEYHLSYLSDAVAASTPALFADYVGWAKIMLAGRGIAADDLAENLRILRDTLERALPPEVSRLAVPPVDVGLARLPQLPAALPTLLARSMHERGQQVFGNGEPHA